MKKLHYIFLAWLIISLIFLNWLFISQGRYLAIYYVIFFVLVGIPLWKFKEQIQGKLQRSKIPFKFLLLGYGMVLLEEIFAALSNHLTEGFSPGLLLIRILQFQLFNIFAFTGFIVGWWILSKKIKYSNTDIFLIAGMFGLFAERVIYSVLINPLIVAFFLLPTMFSYYLIILPAMMSNKKECRQLNFIVKFVITLAVIFLVTLVPIIIVTTLRISYPFLFPPTTFIPA